MGQADGYDVSRQDDCVTLILELINLIYKIMGIMDRIFSRRVEAQSEERRKPEVDHRRAERLNRLGNLLVGDVVVSKSGTQRNILEVLEIDGEKSYRFDTYDKEGRKKKEGDIWPASKFVEGADSIQKIVEFISEIEESPEQESEEAVIRK